MWQLRKLSTNEALSEAGPLPNNWGPIFGLHGFQDKIGDLSWAGPHYADKGWVKLTDSEIADVKMAQVLARKQAEEEAAISAMQDPELTVEGKAKWVNFMLALDLVPLQVDVLTNPRFPARPNI